MNVLVAPGASRRRGFEGRRTEFSSRVSRLVAFVALQLYVRAD